MFYDDYQEKFQETFSNVSTDQIKEMITLDPKDNQKFDFFYSHQTMVGNNFFSKSVNYSHKMSEKEKLKQFVDYLAEVYGVITPEAMKRLFKGKYRYKLIIT